jgi:L-amino acid N-acyltransferase YncA
MPALIRLALPEDASAVAAIYAPFCTETPISFEMTAPTADEMAQRIRKITERLPWLVMEQEGQIAGYVYASPHRERAAYQWSVDVAAYVAPDHHRKGVGRTLYTALFHLLTQQGYFNAYAGVTLPNPASVGLHQAMGFEPVGTYRSVGYKLGAWHDVAWYARTLQPQRANPDPPRSFQELLTDPEWTEVIAEGQALGNKQAANDTQPLKNVPLR